MPKLLTKGTGLFGRPVITTTAAIFLLITLFIGSTAHAFNMEHVDSVLNAAGSTMMINETHVAAPHGAGIMMLELPKQVYQTPFYVPMPEIIPAKSNIRELDAVLDEIADSYASPSAPSFTGIITSRYGMRKHPVRGTVRHHNGVDIAARHGQPVVTPAAGVVTFSGIRGGYGQVVEIDHQNGYTSLLAHNSSLLVRVGDLVEAGKVIARAGRTGVATGVHIHLEIRKHGVLVNPMTYFTPHTH